MDKLSRFYSAFPEYPMGWKIERLGNDGIRLDNMPSQNVGFWLTPVLLLGGGNAYTATWVIENR